MSENTKWYIDQNVKCPFYSRETSSESRKIHCEGYMEGNRIHMFFETKELLKAHKKKYCKNEVGYTKCPIYKIVLKKYEGGTHD